MSDREHSGLAMESSAEADALGVTDPFKDDHSAVEIFHESTKMTPLNVVELGQRVGAILNSPTLRRMTQQNSKSYSAAKKLPLAAARLDPLTLEEALRRRRSQTGDFDVAPINVADLSAILRFSFGPTTKPPPSQVYSPEVMHLRAAPSGGGLHPAEIYPLVMNVEGCADGIYHYSVRDHSLELLRVGSPRAALIAALTEPRPARSSAVTFAVTAVMPRTLSKYLFRGYRFLSYDQGCLLQNFYLTTMAQGLSGCAIGGFYDDEVGRLIGVDNVNECVMALFSIGRPAPGPLATKTLVDVGY